MSITVNCVHSKERTEKSANELLSIKVGGLSGPGLGLADINMQRASFPLNFSFFLLVVSIHVSELKCKFLCQLSILEFQDTL